MRMSFIVPYHNFAYLLIHLLIYLCSKTSFQKFNLVRLHLLQSGQHRLPREMCKNNHEWRTFCPSACTHKSKTC